MHSSSLRGSDFAIQWRGQAVTHAEFCAAVRDTDRLGILVPNRLEAVGALTLIMAYVTAFYDRYRERGPEFFAYPDHFTFQRQAPCANYATCDIWPHHKDVHVPEDRQLTVEAIADRGVNVLLVPDGEPREAEVAPVELESARRNIHRCFAYTEAGQTASPDLIVECTSELLHTYGLALCDSVPEDESVQARREGWDEVAAAGPVRQSFRELELEEALQRV